MAAKESMHHSESEKICAKCAEALIVPEWSQYMGERRVFNLWSCTKCGSCFAEISVALPADAELIDDAKKEDVVPPLLVA